MPNSLKHIPASLMKPFTLNDPNLFPSRVQVQPGIVVMDKGEEWFIDHVVNEQKWGRGHQYLVQWIGEGPETVWLPRAELKDCKVLDIPFFQLPTIF